MSKNAINTLYINKPNDRTTKPCSLCLKFPELIPHINVDISEGLTEQELFDKYRPIALGSKGNNARKIGAFIGFPNFCLALTAHKKHCVIDMPQPDLPTYTGSNETLIDPTIDILTVFIGNTIQQFRYDIKTTCKYCCREAATPFFRDLTKRYLTGSIDLQKAWELYFDKRSLENRKGLRLRDPMPKEFKEHFLTHIRSINKAEIHDDKTLMIMDPERTSRYSVDVFNSVVDKDCPICKLPHRLEADAFLLEAVVHHKTPINLLMDGNDPALLEFLGNPTIEQVEHHYNKHLTVRKDHSVLESETLQYKFEATIRKYLVMLDHLIDSAYAAGEASQLVTAIDNCRKLLETTSKIYTDLMVAKEDKEIKVELSLRYPE